jgi:hypothetical protein
MSAGTVSNCRMINSPWRGGSGGSVAVSGGLMTSCLISNSQPRSWALYLSGGVIEASTIVDNVEPYDNGPVRVAGGTMRRCSVLRNRGNSGSTGGGGIYLTAGRIENSLIAGNYTPQNGKPGGVYQAGGTMVNCTIAANSNLVTATVGAGMHLASGTLTNCIVYGNSGAGGVQYSGPASAAAYSCAPELTSGTGNTTTDPLFVSAAAGDFRLGTGSPCIDAGINQGWMTTATDLDGGRRINGGTVDIGAYESRPPAGSMFKLR